MERFISTDDAKMETCSDVRSNKDGQTNSTLSLDSHGLRDVDTSNESHDCHSAKNKINYVGFECPDVPNARNTLCLFSSLNNFDSQRQNNTLLNVIDENHTTGPQPENIAIPTPYHPQESLSLDRWDNLSSSSGWRRGASDDSSTPQSSNSSDAGCKKWSSANDLPSDIDPYMASSPRAALRPRASLRVPNILNTRGGDWDALLEATLRENAHDSPDECSSEFGRSDAAVDEDRPVGKPSSISLGMLYGDYNSCASPTRRQSSKMQYSTSKSVELPWPLRPGPVRSKTFPTKFSDESMPQTSKSESSEPPDFEPSACNSEPSAPYLQDSSALPVDKPPKSRSKTETEKSNPPVAIERQKQTWTTNLPISSLWQEDFVVSHAYLPNAVLMAQASTPSFKYSPVASQSPLQPATTTPPQTPTNDLSPQPKATEAVLTPNVGELFSPRPYGRRQSFGDSDKLKITESSLDCTGIIANVGNFMRGSLHFPVKELEDRYAYYLRKTNCPKAYHSIVSMAIIHLLFLILKYKKNLYHSGSLGMTNVFGGLMAAWHFSLGQLTEFGSGSSKLDNMWTSLEMIRDTSILLTLTSAGILIRYVNAAQAIDESCSSPDYGRSRKSSAAAAASMLPSNISAAGATVGTNTASTVRHPGQHRKRTAGRQSALIPQVSPTAPDSETETSAFEGNSSNFKANGIRCNIRIRRFLMACWLAMRSLYDTLWCLMSNYELIWVTCWTIALVIAFTHSIIVLALHVKLSPQPSQFGDINTFSRTRPFHYFIKPYYSLKVTSDKLPPTATAPFYFFTMWTFIFVLMTDLLLPIRVCVSGIPHTISLSSTLISSTLLLIISPSNVYNLICMIPLTIFSYLTRISAEACHRKAFANLSAQCEVGRQHAYPKTPRVSRLNAMLGVERLHLYLLQLAHHLVRCPGAEIVAKCVDLVLDPNFLLLSTPNKDARTQPESFRLSMGLDVQHRLPLVKTPDWAALRPIFENETKINETQLCPDEANVEPLIAGDALQWCKHGKSTVSDKAGVQFELDIFQLDAETGGNALLDVGFALIKKCNAFDDSIDVSNKRLYRLLKSIQDRYFDIHYHNRYHGAQVAHHTSWLLNALGLYDIMTPAESVSACLAALAHDIGHPGVNNNFLINSHHFLAIIYNDQNILEQYHASNLFKVLEIPGNNILENCHGVEWQVLRRQMIDMIIATDMQDHFEILGTYKLRRKVKGFLMGNYKEVDRDKRVTMQICIKAADLSYMCLPWLLASDWVNRVYEEFWTQGDMEAEMGLPIIALCDRRDKGQPHWHTNNERFTAAFILPMYTSIAKTQRFLRYRAKKNQNSKRNSSAQQLPPAQSPFSSSSCADGTFQQPTENSKMISVAESQQNQKLYPEPWDLSIFDACVVQLQTNMRKFKQLSIEAEMQIGREGSKCSVI